MRIDYLTKKFMRTMEKEINTQMQLDGKAGWREVKRNLSSKFRLTAKDMDIIASELRMKKKLKIEKRRKNKIALELNGRY